MGARREGSTNNFLVVKAFILLTLLLGLFNQVLDIKAFTFCFWLMAGMALKSQVARAVTPIPEPHLSGEIA
jgi:hypothetical protein